MDHNYFRTHPAIGCQQISGTLYRKLIRRKGVTHYTLRETSHYVTSSDYHKLSSEL